MARILVAILLAGALGSAAFAQSLGDVAKRERERREKNKEQGVAVREISEEEIFGEDDTAAQEDDGADEPPEEAAEASPEATAFEIDEEPGRGGVEELDRARAERRRQEVQWRTRIAEAKTRIERAKARKAQLDGLFLGEGERYVDVNGRVVIRSRAHLQQLVAEVAEELQAAEEALVALRDEARRAGVPPGWLR